MNEVITRRVIKPGDCVLAFAIPTTRAAFVEAIDNPQNRDFVPNHCPDWQDYYREIVDYTDRLLPAIDALGVPLVRDLTFACFSALFEQAQYSAIILFAHWKGDSIEFADGLVPLASVIEAVPNSYQGIIDLCVCHPKELATELYYLRPKSIVRFADTEATPSIWLYFYLTLFKTIQQSDMTYLSALEITIERFLRSKRCERKRPNMKRVVRLLGDYLSEVGALKPVKLGGTGKAVSVTAENRKAFVDRLLKEGKFNNRILICVTVLHFLLFVFAIGLVYYYRASPNAVAVILGGSVLSLLAITRGLQDQWREKWAIDMLVSILPNLSSEEALKVIKSLYDSKGKAGIRNKEVQH